MVAVGKRAGWTVGQQVLIHVRVPGEHQHVASPCLEDLEQVIHGSVGPQEWQISDADVGHLCSSIHVHQNQILDQNEPDQVPPA